MIYTLTLNPALDYDIYLDKLNEGGLNLSNEVNFRAGGKGVNVSIMLKNLGQESTAIGFASGFTGAYIMDSLDDMGIANKFIKTKGTTRINVKINSDDAETEIAGISSDIRDSHLDELFDYVGQFDSDDILVLAGSIPSSLPDDIYKQLAQSTKAQTILDTRGRNLLKNLYSNILIKPNIDELREAFGVDVQSDREICDLAYKFIEMDVKNVLVSMGADGAILINKSKCIKARVPEGRYINSISLRFSNGLFLWDR